MITDKELKQWKKQEAEANKKFKVWLNEKWIEPKLTLEQKEKLKIHEEEKVNIEIHDKQGIFYK